MAEFLLKLIIFIALRMRTMGRAQSPGQVPVLLRQDIVGFLDTGMILRQTRTVVLRDVLKMSKHVPVNI